MCFSLELKLISDTWSMKVVFAGHQGRLIFRHFTIPVVALMVKRRSVAPKIAATRKRSTANPSHILRWIVSSPISLLSTPVPAINPNRTRLIIKWRSLFGIIEKFRPDRQAKSDAIWKNVGTTKIAIAVQTATRSSSSIEVINAVTLGIINVVIFLWVYCVGYQGRAAQFFAGYLITNRHPQLRRVPARVLHQTLPHSRTKHLCPPRSGEYSTTCWPEETSWFSRQWWVNGRVLRPDW